MTHGVRSPRHVVDLRRAGLGTIRRENGSVVIGTTVTYADVLASPEAPPALHDMAAGVTGGAQVHNQGTLGGSACYANPASDVPGVLVGLGATLRLAGSGGARDVAARDFFLGGFQTVLEPGDLLAEIVVPTGPDQERTGYYKFKHCESSWPIATACCTVDQDGAVAGLVLGGVSAAPVVVDKAGGASSEEAVERAVAGTDFEPWTDVLADGWYRRRVAGVVAKRAYLAATG
jgi:CO/xanthine dehydrogenase FAD-binding subunit